MPCAPKYQPIPLKQDITPDEQAFIEAHRNELPELETLEEQRRLYPQDGFAAHLIGYVGEVSEQMLANDRRYAFYSPGDVVGRSGVEATYDALLRGQDGSRDVIVNSHGKEVGQLGQELAVPGKDLRLTIDLDMQTAAEQALEGKNGAIVALDPHTGEVLAMVSRPTFDPNQFSVRLTHSYWQSILTNPDHPLLNKAIQAQLAPGSTFKIIMSVAGLQEGRRAEHACELRGRRELLRALLRVRRASWRRGHPQRHPLLVRHVLLHAGEPAGHRHDCAVCDVAWASVRRPASTCRMRSRARCPRRLEAEDAARQVVCGRDDLRRHRAGRDRGDAAAAGAGASAASLRAVCCTGRTWCCPGRSPEECAARSRRRIPGRARRRLPLTPENWQTITDGMARVTGPGGTAARGAPGRASTLPGRPARRR